MDGLPVEAAFSNAVFCCSVKALAFLHGLFLLETLSILLEAAWLSFVEDRVFLDVGSWEVGFDNDSGSCRLSGAGSVEG